MKQTLSRSKFQQTTIHNQKEKEKSKPYRKNVSKSYKLKKKKHFKDPKPIKTTIQNTKEK